MNERFKKLEHIKSASLEAWVVESLTVVVNLCQFGNTSLTCSMPVFSKLLYSTFHFLQSTEQNFEMSSSQGGLRHPAGLLKGIKKVTIIV